MRRWEFLAILSAIAGLPAAVQAQTAPQARSVAMALAFQENDLEGQKYFVAFQQELRRLGWTLDGDLKLNVKWGVTNADRADQAAIELTRQKPDLIVAHATISTRAFVRQAKDIPIVFTNVSDPVGERFVQSFARPGGNATGFANVEPTIGGKYLELLKEIAPTVSRAVMVYNPTSTPGSGSFFYGPFEAAGAQLSVQTSKREVSNLSELENAITSISQKDGGLVVIGEPFTNLHRARILELTSERKVPAVCPYRFYAEKGCLISYGVDFNDQFKRAASYVDRILKGDKPETLAVQSPVKFEMNINLKTAKSLGVSVPPKLLFTADDVFE
jgi:putative ABC transport system substrate-binding protein